MEHRGDRRAGRANSPGGEEGWKGAQGAAHGHQLGLRRKGSQRVPLDTDDRAKGGSGSVALQGATVLMGRSGFHGCVGLVLRRVCARHCSPFCADTTQRLCGYAMGRVHGIRCSPLLAVYLHDRLCPLSVRCLCSSIGGHVTALCPISLRSAMI